MPRALFLSPESPYPTIGGGPLRSASLVEYLSRHFSVHAIVFRQDGDPDPARFFPAGRLEKLDVLELARHSKSTVARVARNSIRVVRNRPPLVDRFSGFQDTIQKLAAGQHYDVTVVEHFWCAPYVQDLRPFTKRLILDLHNIESVWHRSLADLEQGARALALRRFATASEALERQWLPQFDQLLVTSDEDSKTARELAPHTRITVYPNALPEIPLEERVEREEIVFSGNLEYTPNISAIRFFHDRVWPGLRSRWPILKWKIVGKHPEAIQGIVRGDTRIELTGFVKDAVASLRTAKVAVVPVLAGSGTRVKILEAWAAGTAVVSTTLGAAGLGCRNGEHLLVADDPGSFAGAVSELLASPAARAKIGAGGRKLYEECFTWPAAWRALDAVFGNYRETICHPEGSKL
ncbi:MAG: glycosyltransferase family 4 protein [Bryobacteraceae bacterium]|jgi:glycosyltransferase involved in cell wall biosynthesis